MSSLNIIYMLAINNYSKNFKKIYLYLAATPITFSGDKSPLIVIFSGDYFVATKDPIQAQNISGEFSTTTLAAIILVMCMLNNNTYIFILQVDKSFNQGNFAYTYLLLK